MSNTKKELFPDCITSLPLADIPIEGLTAHILQGKNQQVIFMICDHDTEIPEHSHEAQWGVAIDGRMELTIAGDKLVITRGDTYYIPKGVGHSAKIKKGYKDVIFFNQKDRYKLKSNDSNQGVGKIESQR
jgi:quercetin dioxygenase-like cupin family protein